MDHWQPGQQVLFRQSLPAVGTGTRSISLPVSQWYLYTVQGSASDCGGVPITRGYVRLREGINGFQPFFPVSNGSFAGAYVMTYGSLMDARFEVRNQNSSELAGDTSMLLRAAQNNSLQLKSCVPRTGLWARYTVDGTPYSYTSDLASPTAVNFTGWPGGGGTTISADGFQFSITASGIGTYTGAGVSLIWVNNQYVVLESSQPYRFTFTRFDAFAGMFIEGSYDFYYHDNTLAVHHIVGDFRVRRG
ncbi:MAG: hypothetical protein EOP02_34130 [Proteobacteria bacterium]|nr:MAG: hypothetical protein EOP02_34130 [Pseudomonadota bacterium]